MSTFDDLAAIKTIEESDIAYMDKFMVQLMVSVAKYADSTGRSGIKDGLVDMIRDDFKIEL